MPSALVSELALGRVSLSRVQSCAPTGPASMDEAESERDPFQLLELVGW